MQQIPPVPNPLNILIKLARKFKFMLRFTIYMHFVSTANSEFLLFAFYLLDVIV
jgi:hypothetical protein